MQKHLFITIFICCLFHVYSQDARQIIEKADENFRGKSLQSDVTMTIIRPQWSRSLTMKSWEKGERYSLILITSPPRDNGTAFLKRGNEIWQWLPSIQRTIKIPNSMMNQSWMGSDFTNDDLVREASVVNDYDHKLLSDTTIDGLEAYRIEMIPKAQAPVVWDKVIVWVTKGDFIYRKELFFGEDGELVNIMSLYNVKEVDGRRIPTTWEMAPVDKKGHKTIVEINSIDFDIKIDDSFFSLQNLRKIR